MNPAEPTDERGRPAGNQVIRRATLGATVASAFAASVCCIGPLLAALLGATGLGASVAFHAYRPYFTGVTLLFLAGSFYLTYRNKPEAPEACETGSVCATVGPARIERINRIVLWVVTGFVLLVLTFPTWSGWIWG